MGESSSSGVECEVLPSPTPSTLAMRVSALSGKEPDILQIMVNGRLAHTFDALGKYHIYNEVKDVNDIVIKIYRDGKKTTIARFLLFVPVILELPNREEHADRVDLEKLSTSSIVYIRKTPGVLSHNEGRIVYANKSLVLSDTCKALVLLETTKPGTRVFLGGVDTGSEKGKGEVTVFNTSCHRVGLEANGGSLVKCLLRYMNVNLDAHEWITLKQKGVDWKIIQSGTIKQRCGSAECAVRPVTRM